MEKEPTIFQQHIIDKLKKIPAEFSDNIIERYKIREVLYKSRIPIKLHKEFLEELVELGHIKLHNRKKIELLNCEEDQRDVEIL